MKFRRLLSALLLAAGLVSAAGCGREEKKPEEPAKQKAPSGRGGGGLEKQYKIYHAQGFAAGEFIKALKADGKVLVVVAHVSRRDETMRRLFSGMEKGLGAAPTVDWIDVTEDDEVTADMVNAVLAKHAGVTAVAFFGALPKDFPRMNVGGAKIFLFDSDVVELSVLKKAIEDGKIAGLLMPKLNRPKSSAALEDTDREIFDRRFVIIDPANVAKYGGYFIPR